MFFGAETDELRALAAETDQIGDLVIETRAFLVGLIDVMPTIWVGDDATQLTTSIAQTHAPALQATAGRLATAANEMRTSANRQDQTSNN